MKNKLTQFTMVACATTAMIFTSCGKKDTVDSLSDEIVEQMNAMADAMSSVKDKESAEAAAKKIEEIGDEMEDIAKRMEALGDPSDEDKKLVTEKVEAAQKAMGEKMAKSGGEMATDPEAGKIMMEAMKKFGERMKETEKTMKKFETKED